MKKTKIIATLGPASQKKEVISQMAQEGMDLVRLNFSHGSISSHLKKIRIISEINKKRKKKIKIMQDLEGYRIRVGKLENKKVILENNSTVLLSQKDIIGNQKVIPFDYEGSLKGIGADSFIYIDDGKIVLAIKKVAQKEIKAKVIRGGEVSQRKGINMVGADLDFDPLTQKDKRDLASTQNYKIDYIAQSFVRSKKDLFALKELLKKQKRKVKVFAKVESLQALSNIDQIIAESDGVIVARGDLGICLPIYKVPLAQKRILEKTKKANKPSVVATQMLESMIQNPTPTRAESSDVANAILDGADFLLFSGETAIGRYPAKVIKIAQKIIDFTTKNKGKDIL